MIWLVLDDTRVRWEPGIKWTMLRPKQQWWRTRQGSLTFLILIRSWIIQVGIYIIYICKILNHPSWTIYKIYKILDIDKYRQLNPHGRWLRHVERVRPGHLLHPQRPSQNHPPGAGFCKILQQNWNCFIFTVGLLWCCLLCVSKMITMILIILQKNFCDLMRES